MIFFPKKVQELFCHDCGHYLRFKTKPWRTGNIIIVCDYCGHQHCRHVIKGQVKKDRWDKRYSSVDKTNGAMARQSLWEEEREANKK